VKACVVAKPSANKTATFIMVIVGMEASLDRRPVMISIKLANEWHYKSVE